MTAEIDSVEYKSAIQILVYDHARHLTETYSGQVWEYYPEIHEHAARQLADELSRWPRRPTPAEVEWAEEQLRAIDPTNYYSEDGEEGVD
ncbi:hypothetical protein [Actinomyces sp. MRS3W]|uniref:hypothetical protein n=1 Tax=Actinomyces sp. MRS3W TaxID=2800796 RepID=UPI0028FD132C|nr:hypothetical protein [Actinomyces sp. MRS3W]MDU0348308.1 hypothetical protein [Actinomyces sp. MRS3W]